MYLEQLPEAGFVRLRLIIGSKKDGIPALIPISKPTWFRGIRDGRYPRAIKLGRNSYVWNVADIRALMERLASEGK